MANDLILENYQAIADAIRSKTGSESSLTPNEMPQAIEDMITIEDMDVFEPDSTKYYQSSYGYPLYYPSGRTQDMTEVSGDIFENTGGVEVGYYYYAKESGDIGYNGNSPLTQMSSGEWFEAVAGVNEDTLYRATTDADVGFNGELPLNKISGEVFESSTSVYTDEIYQITKDADLGYNGSSPLGTVSGSVYTNEFYAGLGYVYIGKCDATMGFNESESPLEQAEGVLFDKEAGTQSGYFYYPDSGISLGINNEDEQSWHEVMGKSIMKDYIYCARIDNTIAHTNIAGDPEDGYPFYTETRLPQNVNDSVTLTLDGKTYTVTRTA